MRARCLHGFYQLCCLALISEGAISLTTEQKRDMYLYMHYAFKDLAKLYSKIESL
jgi:hypothetical protein